MQTYKVSILCSWISTTLSVAFLLALFVTGSARIPYVSSSVIFTIECITCNGEIFTKFKNKIHKFLNVCYSAKEGANGKNYGNTMIPKAWGVQKSLLCVSTSKETKDTSICLPHVGRAVCENFFSSLHLHPGYNNNMEEKTYPAMDLPVYGECTGVNFILVEDWICKLWFLI